MQLRKAERRKAKIRIGFSSVSGGGKTASALLVAYGITGDWNKIAVIDTENESADLYSNHTLTNGVTIGQFQVLPLHAPFAPERYIEAIHTCEGDPDIEVIIIDSITHEWEGSGGIIQLTDEIGGGFSSAWKQLTPRHEAFKQAILQSKCHVFTTVRRKQDYILVEDVNKSGRTVQKPVKAGFKEITREGWEYELTLNLELELTHTATASKDRTGLFMGRPPFIPSIETGEMIKHWCESGIDIQEEINDSIKKLANCSSVDELKRLKEILPAYVVSDTDFKTAATKRYNEVKPDPKPATQAQTT